MTDTKQLTGVMIAYGRQCAMSALRSAGVPLNVAQKLVMSIAWTREQKQIVSEKVKEMAKKGQPK